MQMGLLLINLPMELLEYLFSILSDQHDATSLLALSTTSSVLRPIAQRLLLRNISFPEDHPVDSPVSFLRALQGSPQIADYVRSLTIVSPWRHVASIPAVRIWDGQPQSDGGALVHVLDHLPKLQKLAIKGRKSQISKRRLRPLPWLVYSMVFQTTFVQWIPSQNLVELEVTGIDRFPVSILSKFQTLTRLSLTSLDVDDELEHNHVGDGAQHPAASQLSYLHLEDMAEARNILYWLNNQQHLGIKGVQDLSVALAIGKDLNSTGISESLTSLRHLRLVTNMKILTSYNSLKFILSQYNATESPLPSFANFPPLETLAIDAVFFLRTFLHKSLVDFFTSPLPWIADFLQGICRSPTAESLSKLVFDFAFHDFNGQLQVMNTLSWEMLSRVLTPSYFPKLVTVEMRVKGLDRIQMDTIRQNSYLMPLTTSGLLVIS